MRILFLILALQTAMASTVLADPHHRLFHFNRYGVSNPSKITTFKYPLRIWAGKSESNINDATSDLNGKYKSDFYSGSYQHETTLNDIPVGVIAVAGKSNGNSNKNKFEFAREGFAIGGKYSDRIRYGISQSKYKARENDLDKEANIENTLYGLTFVVAAPFTLGFSVGDEKIETTNFFIDPIDEFDNERSISSYYCSLGGSFENWILQLDYDKSNKDSFKTENSKISGVEHDNITLLIGYDPYYLEISQSEALNEPIEIKSKYLAVFIGLGDNFVLVVNKSISEIFSNDKSEGKSDDSGIQINVRY